MECGEISIWARCDLPFPRLKAMEKGQVLLAPNYSLPKPLVDNVYKPYLQDFAAALRQQDNGYEPKVQRVSPGIFSLAKALILLLYGNLWRLWVNRVVSIRGFSQ